MYFFSYTQWPSLFTVLAVDHKDQFAYLIQICINWHNLSIWMENILEVFPILYSTPVE